MPTVYSTSGSHLYETCELRQWAMQNGWGPCCDGVTDEHIISKAMLQKNAAARKLVDGKYRKFFIAKVCLVHNSGNKCADTKGARLFLLRKRWRQYGNEFEEALAVLREEFKAPPEYLSLECLV